MKKILGAVLLICLVTLVGCQSEHQHTIVIDEAVASTCTTAGLTAGSHCEDCGEILTARQKVPALGHTEASIPGKAPTCTEAGLSDGKKCSVCDTVTVAQEPLAALGHTEAPIPGKAPTCTEAGLSDGKKCSVCDAVTVAQEPLAALGHTEAPRPGKAPTCTEAGLSDGKKCSICDAVTVAQEPLAALGHTEASIPGKAPTCTEAGLSDGKKCSVCDTVTVAQEPLAALGHDFSVQITLTGKNCQQIAFFDVMVCTYCKVYITDTVTVDDVDAAFAHRILGSEKGDRGAHQMSNIIDTATCHEGGILYRYCEIASCDYKEHHGVSLKLDHVYGDMPDPTLSVPATPTTPGLHIYCCQLCDRTPACAACQRTEPIPVGFVFFAGAVNKDNPGEKITSGDTIAFTVYMESSGLSLWSIAMDIGFDTTALTYLGYDCCADGVEIFGSAANFMGTGAAVANRIGGTVIYATHQIPGGALTDSDPVFGKKEWVTLYFKVNDNFCPADAPENCLETAITFTLIKAMDHTSTAIPCTYPTQSVIQVFYNAN